MTDAGLTSPASHCPSQVPAPPVEGLFFGNLSDAHQFHHTVAPMTNNTGDGPWYPAIHAKLTSIAAELSARPAWYEQWLQLDANASDEERLSVYQAIRDASVLPADAGFYLVTWQIDAMSSKAAEAELCDMDEQMIAIEHEHGLNEAEFWTPEEAPPEYERLRLAYQEAWNDIFVRLLRHFGEHEVIPS